MFYLFSLRIFTAEFFFSLNECRWAIMYNVLVRLAQGLEYAAPSEYKTSKDLLDQLTKNLKCLGYT